MKNILIILLNIALLSACKNSEKKDFVTLSGKIENNKDSIIRIFNREGLVKEFAINKDGSFQEFGCYSPRRSQASLAKGQGR